MWSSTAIIWVTFAIIGQWCLLGLLGTFLAVGSLRQRDNPFLVNFIFSTFLSTIPLCLLFFAGYQDEKPPEWLCFLQSTLMDGVPPMFGTAMVVFVFHTWRDLRAKLLGESPLTATNPWFKWLLLLLPYVTLAAWCIASLVVGLKSPSEVQLSELVFCANLSVSGTQVRHFLGFFLFAFGILEFAFEICIVRLIRLHSSGAPTHVSTESYHESYNLAIRILVFCIWEVVIILLTVFNSVLKIQTESMRDATLILESTNALATFLVFGTQKDVLRSWKFWDRRPKLITMTQRNLPQFKPQGEAMV